MVFVGATVARVDSGLDVLLGVAATHRSKKRGEFHTVVLCLGRHHRRMLADAPCLISQPWQPAIEIIFASAAVTLGRHDLTMPCDCSDRWSRGDPLYLSFAPRVLARCNLRNRQLTKPVAKLFSCYRNRHVRDPVQRFSCGSATAVRRG
jgi:hypothetical protein